MSREEEILKKRFIELSRTSYERDIYVFSDFLNLNELDLFNRISKNDLYGKYEIFGGYHLAQRQMIKFLPGAVFYDMPYPFKAISISAKSSKYSEKLGHRDYLGAIINLGIDRSKIGDILVEDNAAICFINENFVEFIKKELIKIKHTYVVVETTDIVDENFEPKYEIVSGSVQSVRLDAVLALVIKESRSQLVRYIESGKVFVNSKLVTSNGCRLAVNDLISVRGVGKFQYIGEGGVSKKGKQFVEVKRYI